jgi:hypothetical protein
MPTSASWAAPAIPDDEVSSPTPRGRSAKSAAAFEMFRRAGHASLGTTARYIEADHEAHRKVVALI